MKMNVNLDESDLTEAIAYWLWEKRKLKTMGLPALVADQDDRTGRMIVSASVTVELIEDDPGQIDLFESELNR